MNIRAAGSGGRTSMQLRIALNPSMDRLSDLRNRPAGCRSITIRLRAWMRCGICGVFPLMIQAGAAVMQAGAPGFQPIDAARHRGDRGGAARLHLKKRFAFAVRRRRQTP